MSIDNQEIKTIVSLNNNSISQIHKGQKEQEEEIVEITTTSTRNKFFKESSFDFGVPILI